MNLDGIPRKAPRFEHISNLGEPRLPSREIDGRAGRSVMNLRVYRERKTGKGFEQFFERSGVHFDPHAHQLAFRSA